MFININIKRNTIINILSIFKTSFSNLRLIPRGLKVKTLVKPKAGLNFFVNTAKTKTKDLAKTICECGPWGITACRVIGVLGCNSELNNISSLVEKIYLRLS